jgi:hypothetical protein
MLYARMLGRLGNGYANYLVHFISCLHCFTTVKMFIDVYNVICASG